MNNVNRQKNVLFWGRGYPLDMLAYGTTFVVATVNKIALLIVIWNEPMLYARIFLSAA